MKKLLVPAVAGVVVFGAVTAFAASLTVNSNSLGSGNATVTSCNSSATVSYTTAPTTNAKTYDVATATVTSAIACHGMAYDVTLYDGTNAVLGEKTGTLDANGSATLDFSGSTVPAHDVAGVAVVITG